MIPRNHGTAFVLSGGGNLGAMQVGTLRALLEHGVKPSMIVGTSVGAVNGAFLARRPDRAAIDELVGFWSSLRRRDVLGFSLSTLIGGLLGHHAYLFDARRMHYILESFLGDRRIEDASLPFAVVATDVATGEPVVLDNGDLVTALLASCAIPRVLPPVEINLHLLGDGATSADIPLREAIDLGARNTYVIPTAPLQVDRLRQELALHRSSADAEDEVTVRIVPPLAVHIPLGDLHQSSRLIGLSYLRTKQWLAANVAAESTPVRS